MATMVPRAATGGFPLAAVAVLAGALLQVLTPLLPQLGIGEPIGSRSDAVRTLVTPAGWAFAIWGALYAGSAVFAIYQALPAQRADPLLAATRWPAAGAFLGNALWAAYTQVAGLAAPSVVIIAATLACLLAIYRSLSRTTLTAGQRWCAWLPLSALASWLTVATLVNTAATLRFHGIEAGDGAPLAAAGVLVVGGLIALAALAAGRGNPPFAAVFLYALYAIHAARSEITAVTAGCAAAALLVVAGVVIGRRQPVRGR